MENPRLVECFDPERSACTIHGTCELKRALQLAQGAFLDALDGYSLADLLAPHRKLHRALGLGSGI